MLPKINKTVEHNRVFNVNKNEYIDNNVKDECKYKYKLMFDGGSRGNPGLGGAGAVLYCFEQEIWSGTFFVGENATNNHSEYAGLILGLCQALKQGITELKVEGDSLLVINQVTGKYKCRSDNLIELYDKSLELIKQFKYIDFEHVLRNKNKRADELSNIAIDTYLKKI